MMVEQEIRDYDRRGWGERERAEEAHAQLCKQVSFEIAFKVLGMLCIYVDAEGRAVRAASLVHLVCTTWRMINIITSTQSSC